MTDEKVWPDEVMVCCDVICGQDEILCGVPSLARQIRQIIH